MWIAVLRVLLALRERPRPWQRPGPGGRGVRGHARVSQRSAATRSSIAGPR